MSAECNVRGYLSIVGGFIFESLNLRSICKLESPRLSAFKIQFVMKP